MGEGIPLRSPSGKAVTPCPEHTEVQTVAHVRLRQPQRLLYRSQEAAGDPRVSLAAMREVLETVLATSGLSRPTGPPSNSTPTYSDFSKHSDLFCRSPAAAQALGRKRELGDDVATDATDATDEAIRQLQTRIPKSQNP